MPHLRRHESRVVCIPLGEENATRQRALLLELIREQEKFSEFSWHKMQQRQTAHLRYPWRLCLKSGSQKLQKKYPPLQSPHGDCAERRGTQRLREQLFHAIRRYRGDTSDGR